MLVRKKKEKMAESLFLPAPFVAFPSVGPPPCRACLCINAARIRVDKCHPKIFTPKGCPRFERRPAKCHRPVPYREPLVELVQVDDAKEESVTFDSTAQSWPQTSNRGSSSDSRSSKSKRRCHCCHA